MRVLAFGTYQRDYPRHGQVVASLRRAGVEVAERHVEVWRGRDGWTAGAGTAARLALAQARLVASGSARHADALLVGYPGHADVPAARLAARGAPVVFDPLVSLHDTLVEDRGRFRRGSVAARALRRLDRAALRGADVVVADTAAGADRLRELGELPPERVEVCFVGAEERLFTPGWRRRERFRALFVGKLIPLHGLETIVAAARLLPDVPFRVVGSGQREDLLRARPRNVEWVEWVEYERLPGENHEAGCVLGIFGTSAKAARVIPNKAFQALACGAPLVTADTPAARELLVDGKSALLVPPGEPEALAGAVLRLRDDAALAGRIAAGGHDSYRRHASEEVLGARWRALFERVTA